MKRAPKTACLRGPFLGARGTQSAPVVLSGSLDGRKPSVSSPIASDWNTDSPARRHHIPKDDAFKQAHLAMLAKLGKRAWLHCDGCRHSIMIEPDELAQRHRLDMLTPLLTISKAMRCTHCGARKGCCWPEPHDTRTGERC
jgi:hypothetical protein